MYGQKTLNENNNSL